MNTFKALVFGLGACALLFSALGVLALTLIGIPTGLFYGVGHLTGSLALAVSSMLFGCGVSAGILIALT